MSINASGLQASSKAGATKNAGDTLDPAQEILRVLDEELDSVRLTHGRGQKVYQSLSKLSELIGGEYGDRVIYELLQNAHDALTDGAGDVAVRLSVAGPDNGDLYIANGGNGFSFDNLQAIRNIATSTKEIGEGIGNKGVGFRSVEALTDDACIYSCIGRGAKRDRFDGYCFRFAKPNEIVDRLNRTVKSVDSAVIASSIPRYLATVPVAAQSSDICAFAKSGFATVVHLPLRSAEAVNLATRQVSELVTSDAPVLLFLGRMSRLDVTFEGVPGKKSVRLTRKEDQLADEANGQQLLAVTLGPSSQRWLVVRQTLPKEAVIDAVKKSIPLESGLKAWVNWRGDAVVSLAVPIEGMALKNPRLYTFLPMDAGAQSPCFAHVDAPFFTNISRRQARLDLPLNSYLLDAAAEAAASAALKVTELGARVPRSCVVDLACWRASQSARIGKAFQKVGQPISTAPVWPTASGDWAGLADLRIWPEGPLKVLTLRRATRSGVKNILDPRLAPGRKEAVQELADVLGLDCEPERVQRAEWAEQIAKHLPAPKVDDELWADFFADLTTLFGKNANSYGPGPLSTLRGFNIIPDREGELRPAGADIYIRHDVGRRKSDGPPLPPRSITRKLVVLTEKVRPRHDTVALFEKAELWRRYDPTEILERLPSLFGERPAPARRQEALAWAFLVWSLDPKGVQAALKKADLQVPVRGGWLPSQEAAFSETWTDGGRELEAFLAEARDSSPECADAASGLLLGFTEVSAGKGTLREWTNFLGDAGVTDGLVAIAPSAPTGPAQGNEWRSPLQLNLGTHWPDATWDAPAHPWTNYWRDGEPWKLPGQDEVEKLSPEARRRFASLVVRHLQSHGQRQLNFKLARTDRAERDHDVCTQQTPIAAFIAKADWFPMEDSDGESFAPLDEAWFLPERKHDQRFLPRPSEELRHLLGRSSAALEILSDRFGMRIWSARGTAGARLSALARVCDPLAAHDRPPFLTQYVRAWKDLCDSVGKLPPGVALVTRRPDGYAAVEPGGHIRIYVPTGASADIGRLLVESGEALLALNDEVDADQVVQAINGGGDFEAVPADRAEIRLLVDGQRFAASGQDPLLTDKIPWLEEALAIGLELGARSLEKTARLPVLLDKLRRLRVRLADSILLEAGQGEERSLVRHLYRDDQWPTLIVRAPFDAQRLEACATVITDYLNQNLRTFELLLVKLTYRLAAFGKLDGAPTESDYVDALDTDLSTVRAHLAAFRRNDEATLQTLTPLVAYYIGTDRAQELIAGLSGGHRENWLAILNAHMSVNEAQDLLAAVEETDDLLAIQGMLGLDYARLNQAMAALGFPSLTSEASLRRAFTSRMVELYDSLLDRLRRTFAANWLEPEKVKAYAAARSLEFIGFEPSWLATAQNLTLEMVQAHAEAEMMSRFGPDPGVESLPAKNPKTANRKTVGAFAERARPLLLALKGVEAPPPWKGSAKDVVDALELAGLLDFYPLSSDEEIFRVLKVAGLWPAATLASLDLAAHQLTAEDLDREQRLEREKREIEIKAKNTISFSGIDFDTTDSNFAAKFAAAAQQEFENSDWRKRSILRPVVLQPQEEATPSPGGRGGGRKLPKPPNKPPEAVRSAIGLAGELLAYQYLKAKHSRHFTEACWVSENRTSLFAEPGSISEGCDFRIETSDTEWFYEVKASPHEGFEFELTDNEYRTAVAAAEQPSMDYRILYVQHAFDPKICRVLELPNPAGRASRGFFRTVGRASVRMRFEPARA